MRRHVCVCVHVSVYMDFACVVTVALSVILFEQAIELMYDILIWVFVHDFAVTIHWHCVAQSASMHSQSPQCHLSDTFSFIL